MKNDRINYVLVGGFVLAMVAALVVTIAVLSGRAGPTDTYYTGFADATGLKFGSQVLYMGYPVGQVEQVRPQIKDGVVSFELDLSIAKEFAHWKVPADSIAETRSAGLLAAVTVDIRSGTSTEALRPGDRIRSRERSDMFGAMTDTANTVRDLTLTSVKPLLENLNRYVSSVGSVLELRGGPLIENLGKLSEELAGRAPEVIDDFLATTRDLRAVSARLELLLSDENAAKLGEVVDNVLAASQDLSRLAVAARAQAEQIADAGVAARVDRVLGSVDAAAADLAGMGATARAGVDSLFAGENVARVERSLANVELASAGARDLVGPERQAQVDATLDSAARAAAQLESLIAETRAQVRTLLGPDTVARFDRALENLAAAGANVAALAAHVDARVGEVLTADVAAKLRRALENFALAAANVATLTRGLEHSRGTLDALLLSLRGTVEENRGDVRAVVRDLRLSLATVAQHIDAVSQGLEITARNMAEFSHRLKSDPGLLLRGAPPVTEGGAVRRGQ